MNRLFNLLQSATVSTDLGGFWGCFKKEPVFTLYVSIQVKKSLTSLPQKRGRTAGQVEHGIPLGDVRQSTRYSIGPKSVPPPK